MKRVFSVFLMAVLLTGSLGCLAPESLDLFGYVILIGFDEGETLPYRITFAIQNANGSAEAEGKQTETAYLSAECRDFYEAVETISANLPYRLDFARTIALMISESLAKEENAVAELMNISYPKLHIRNNIAVFVCLDSAEKTMRGLNNDLAPNLSKLQTSYVRYARETGLTSVSSITLLYEALADKSWDIVLPLCGARPDEGESRREQDSVGTRYYAYIGGRMLVDTPMDTGIAGCALISAGHMVGVLDGQHTQTLLMVNGDFEKGRLRIEDAEGRERSILLKRSMPRRIDISLDTQPRAWVTVSLIADVEMPDALESIEAEALERQIEAYLEKEMRDVFEACRSLECDAMGFGRAARMKFMDTDAWEAYDWQGAYRVLEASFEVNVRMSYNPNKSVLE